MRFDRAFKSGWMRSRAGSVVALAAAGLLGIAGTARATPAGLPGVFTFNITPDGTGNIDVTGSGTVNLAGVDNQGTDHSYNPDMNPSGDDLNSGPDSSNFAADEWFSATGPSTFGTGSYSFANSGTGDFVSFIYESGPVQFGLPTSYVSGATLNDTSVYSGTTLAALGLTSGTSYTWSWPAGSTTDTVNINVGTVPEPASAGIIGIAGLGMLRRRRSIVA